MADRTLVIVEDDEAFARTLARSFERRDYRVHVVHGAEASRMLDGRSVGNGCRFMGVAGRRLLGTGKGSQRLFGGERLGDRRCRRNMRRGGTTG